LITIIDYGMGNLKSVSKAFEKVGEQVIVTNDSKIIREAEALVVPGVGAFGDAMKNLKAMGLIDIIKDKAREGIPLLGICLGMQLLFSDSEEGGTHKGLNLLKGSVVKFRGNVKVPHVGWNQIKRVRQHKLVEGIEDCSYFYFVHSYYVKPEIEELVVAVTPYSVDFPAVVCRDNVMGVQFHPEKSSSRGLKILKNFGEMVRCS